jgi:hypothetical protein
VPGCVDDSVDVRGFEIAADPGNAVVLDEEIDAAMY